PPPANRRAEARRELEAARKCDPSLPVKWVEAQAAMHRRDFAEAEASFRQALGEDPEEVNWARGAALALCLNPQKAGRAAGVGEVFAGRRRGTGALDRLAGDGQELVAGGQVVRARHESGLTRLYALALVAGLVLFYASVPFVLAGLLGGMALLLYLIFHLPRI